jgi:predicted phage terminase large subunit-like protein
LKLQLPQHARYYINSESCYLDDDTTPRFPNILPAEKLSTIKIEKGPLLFSCQYRNQPMPAEHQIFRLEALRTIPIEQINLQNAEAYGFCDPSLGVNDYSGIVTVLKHNGRWVVFHADLSKTKQSELISTIIELHKVFHYRVFGIEANSIGKAKSDTSLCTFELVLREKQAEAETTIPYRLVWHNTQKHARIEALEPYISNGQLLFLTNWNHDYPLLIEQLVHFPLAAHDDGPDALAGVIALITQGQERAAILVPRGR